MYGHVRWCKQRSISTCFKTAQISETKVGIVIIAAHVRGHPSDIPIVGGYIPRLFRLCRRPIDNSQRRPVDARHLDEG